MALKTNFTDDILAESMNGKRQYNVTENSNGTKSLEDVTDYQSVGSTFSAKNMNETNAAVNQAYDDMGDEFNPEVDYAVGDYTIHNNKVWKFTTAHQAGAWDESHVKATKILSEARELTENMVPNYNNMSTLYQSNSDITTQVTTINKDGWLQCVAKTAVASGIPFIRLYINNVMVYEKTGITSNYSYAWSPLFRVKKGDIIQYTLTTETSDGLKELRFYLP